jgi:hypothetical protein
LCALDRMQFLIASMRLEIGGATSVTSAERSTVRAFLDAYRTAFETFDAAAVADLFHYPCQITSGGAEVTVAVIPTRDAWMPQLERLVAAYRSIGVRSAEARAVDVAELTTRLAGAVVHWGLFDEQGRPIYDFDASYTLADLGEGMRITAIAHNETPRLRAVIERQRLP